MPDAEDDLGMTWINGVVPFGTGAANAAGDKQKQMVANNRTISFFIAMTFSGGRSTRRRVGSRAI